MPSYQDESDIWNLHASSKRKSSGLNEKAGSQLWTQNPHRSFSYNQIYQICFRECIYQQWKALCWFLILHCLVKKKKNHFPRDVCIGHKAVRLIDWLMIAYIALFSALLSRLTALVCGSAWVTSFYSSFFEYQAKWCTYSAGMADSTWNCSRLVTSPVYTIQPCTMSLHAKPHT